MDIMRDGDGVAHIVALSGGKDSTAMALRLIEKEPRPYTFVCTPTGDELPEMIHHMNRLETLIGSRILRLTNGTLKSQIEANNMLPNVFARWCTRLLKLAPFGRFMQQASPCVAYVGIRDDEDERKGTRPGGDSAPVGTQAIQDFPFQRWGWGIEQVLGYLESRGVKVPDRTDCARCPYQRLAEWYNLWLFHPDIYADAEGDEEKYGYTYRSATRDTWPASLKEMRAIFETGRKPDRSLKMMERKNMCRACTM